jgi:SAM-dependent methyltransferase
MSNYVLGHDAAELQRLIEQSEFFGVLTRQLWREAGLAPGMTVLDVGCGAGDTTLLAAELVGPSGRVIGVDRSAQGLALARRRAEAAGLTNVEFREADAAELVLDQPVDALVGRLVLMYFRDHATALRRLAEHVRPGGLIVLQEMDVLGGSSEPAVPLFDQTLRWVHDAFARAGANPSMGRGLLAAFLGADLPRPRMLLGARVESGPDSAAYPALAGIARTLLPVMEANGIASAAQVGIDTLVERLRGEAVAIGATIYAPPLIGAWVRK